MTYKNVKSGEIVDLIFNDGTYKILVPINPDNIDSVDGRIHYGSKKDFKKEWVKCKIKNYVELDDGMKYHIIETLKKDRNKIETDLDNLIIESQLHFQKLENIDV